MGITQSKRLANYFAQNNVDRAGKLTPAQRRRLRKKSNQLLQTNAHDHSQCEAGTVYGDK